MHFFGHKQSLPKTFEINGNKEISCLFLDGSVYLPFLKIGLSFATLQALEKVLEVIKKLKIF